MIERRTVLKNMREPNRFVVFVFVFLGFLFACLLALAVAWIISRIMETGHFILLAVFMACFGVLALVSQTPKTQNAEKTKESGSKMDDLILDISEALDNFNSVHINEK